MSITYQLNQDVIIGVKPIIEVKVEPMETGKVVFLPMAAAQAGEKGNGRICLQVNIKNISTKDITMDEVTISFPGSSVPAEVKKIFILSDDVEKPVKIVAGASKAWWFQKAKDDIIIPLPFPKKIKLAFKCLELGQPSEFTYPLAPHVSPVKGGAYLFPASGKDLDLGEYWSAYGRTHSDGAKGSQLFGYDMGVWGVNHENESYSNLHPNTDGTKNNHFRIWGKPVRAMADGIVISSLNDCPNNPHPLKWSSKEELKQLSNEQKDKYWGPFSGAGNHFYIQHGDEVVLYAHMQKGSLNKSLLITPGNPKPKVKAGDFLGYAGNSGSSTGPHLHIHAIQGTKPETGPLRPIILKNAWVIDQDLLVGETQYGLWSPVSKRGIPDEKVFLWPDASLPEWPEIVKLGIKENTYQSVFNEMKSRGFRPVWFDAYTIDKPFVKDTTYFNVIFRPATGVKQAVWHGLTGEKYQAKFDKWVKDKGYRLVHIESYFSHTARRIVYAPIFVKSPGPAFKTYHGVSKAKHQELFNEYTKKDGYTPVNVSVVSYRGQRIYTALYEKQDFGGCYARSTLTPVKYQQLFDENADKGFYLGYLNAYVHKGKINMSAIWYGKLTPPYVRHHLSSQKFATEMQAQRKKNLYLRCVTGYQNGKTPNFGAIWNK